MNAKTASIVIVIVAGSLVGSALLVRNGLESVAAAIRDKPLPQMPDKLSVRELTIQHATVEPPGSSAGTMPSLKLTIENMRVEGVTTPAPAKNGTDHE